MSPRANNDDDHLISSLFRTDRPPRRCRHPFSIRHATATKFLHNQRHGKNLRTKMPRWKGTKEMIFLAPDLEGRGKRRAFEDQRALKGEQVVDGIACRCLVLSFGVSRQAPLSGTRALSVFPNLFKQGA